MPVGALTGGLLASYPMGRFGRKNTVILSGMTFAISFCLLGSAYLHEIVELIMTSRVIMGLGIGLSVPSVQIYVSMSMYTLG